MKQERGMHRLGHGIVAPKGKRNVADTAADARAEQILFDPACRFNEIDRIIAVFLQTGRDRENIRIEDDVVCWKIGAFGQNLVSAHADVDLTLEIVALALFIERHHDYGCAITPDESRLAQKF